jgi:hypothetical protein
MVKALKRSLRITLYAAASIILLLVMLAGVTQTGFFKDRLRAIIVSRLSTQLNGSLSLGAISGNLVTGFTIDSVAVFRQSELVLSVDKILFSYDPLFVFKKTLKANYLILENPTINIRRSSSGIWNFNEILKSPDNNQEGSSGGSIDIADIQIKRGTISLIDSFALASPDHHAAASPSEVEYHHFMLHDVNILFSALAEHDRYSLRIRHANFYSPQPEMELSHFKGDFFLDTGKVSAKNVVIQTRQTYLELDAEIHGVNVFAGVNLSRLQHDSTTLHLKANNISFSELKSFLPAVHFLEGSANVECDAHGEFGNLSIPRLNIQTYQSTLKLAGSLRNLHRPEELYLDVVLNNSKLNAADIAKLLPSFGLPKFETLGQSTLFTEFKGTPLKFAATTSFTGAYGAINITGEMNLEQTPPRYHALFSTTNVDLGVLTENKSITTSLTSSGDLTGTGFSLDTLTADLRLTLGSSRVQEFMMDTSTIAVHAVPHHITLVSSLGAQQSRASLTASGDFTNRHLPAYTGEVSFSGFDFSKLLHDRTYESNITLHGSLNGSGTTIDDFNGQAELSLLPSLYQQRELPAEQLAIRLDQQDNSNKLLTVQSSFADITCKGKFDIDLVVDALEKQSANLISSIKEHATPLDSLHIKKTITGTHLPPHTTAQRELDFSYAINVNDLSTIAIVAGETDFNARGTLNGTIKGTDDVMSITADGSIDEFFIGSINDGIFLNTTTVSLALRNLTPVQTLDQLSGKFVITVGSGISRKTTFEEVHVDLDYHQLKGILSVKGQLDSVYNIAFGGEASIQPNTYALDIDTLIVSSGVYRWRNNQDVQIRANYDGVRVLHAEMIRNKESLSLVGVLHHDGIVDLTGTLDHYDMGGLSLWLRNSELSLPGHGLSGTGTAGFHLSGSTSSPVISFSATCESTYFHQTRIGDVHAGIMYENKRASIDINVKTYPHDTSSSLIVKGNIPIDLAFSNAGERFPDDEQHLEIFSNGFDVSVLDPLLADFDDLSGTLQCNVLIAGSTHTPRYSGTITLSKLKFIFGPNSIPYIVNGELEPSGNKLIIKNLTATNPPGEPNISDARFVGSAVIKNFQIETFDVTAYGKILLMTEATRRNIPSFYGPLFAEIDPNGLNLKGTLQEPFLSGKLYSLSTDLLFPATKYTEGVNANQILRYVAVDTVKRRTRPKTFSYKFFSENDSLADRSEIIQGGFEPSFVDRLRYNLEIETRGTTAIRMIFTPSTNEELYAEIEGKVNAINNRGTPSVYGDITVTQRSYYNFFKRFDATGKLRFVGPWDDPQLDIDAKYEAYGQVNPAKTIDASGNEQSSISSEKKIIVGLTISGTRYDPKLLIGMKVQEEPGKDPVEYAGSSGDVQSDAISFIITGKLRDQISPSERENLAANFGSAGVSGITSNLLSGIFTDFLRKEFPFIRNAEFSYQGGNVQESADVGITGEAYKGYWRIRGKILNDLGNANLSYQTSLGDIFNLSSIRNLFIELERRVEGNDLNAASRLTTNNARLFYRISF